MEISVIVPTHNGASSFLADTLLSLQAQNFPSDEYEIIVSDNASTDETKTLVEKISNNGGHKIEYVFERRLGLDFSRHAGAKIAKGAILAYTDDDVICDGNWLSEIIKPYWDSEVGCVGGRTFPKWEIEPPIWIKNMPSFYLSVTDRGETMKEVQTTPGCNFSVRKSLVFELGGFHPDLVADKKLKWYTGDGEVGLLRKVQRAGKKVIYTPEAIVWHIIPKRRLTLNYFKKRAFQDGMENSFVRYVYSSREPGKLDFLLDSGVFGSFFVLNKFLAIGDKFLGNNYHCRECESSRNNARFRYALKMIYDGKFNKYVLNFRTSNYMNIF